MFKTRSHKYLPETFPEPWASGWGEDEFGLWMSFTYKGVSQVFRWCEPTESFLMGSHEDEPERLSNETLHKVKFTKGFWIAETTVTQALWQAAMGENPSSFKDNNNPVDSVSWEDAQTFISKLNGLNPELSLRLPTEAEWEYACRAETTTPFNFGEQIDSSLVNFNGNNPYNDGEKSERRGETIQVKTLPPNDWGLYEMHGNVLEWCNDWYGVYPDAPISEAWIADPTGPEQGDVRVLRGGSWASFGGSCRSAYRNDNDPTERNDFIGFRLSHGH